MSGSVSDSVSDSDYSVKTILKTETNLKTETASLKACNLAISALNARARQLRVEPVPISTTASLSQAGNPTGLLTDRAGPLNFTSSPCRTRTCAEPDAFSSTSADDLK